MMMIIIIIIIIITIVIIIIINIDVGDQAVVALLQVPTVLHQRKKRAEKLCYLKIRKSFWLERKSLRKIICLNN